MYKCSLWIIFNTFDSVEVTRDEADTVNKDEDESKSEMINDDITEYSPFYLNY